MLVTVDTVPSTPEELAACLDSVEWRLHNLYKIITKKEDAEDGTFVTFRANRAQRRFMRRIWHRNDILKARQLGFSTLICILWLDTALFSTTPMRCGIIAQDKETAEKLFEKITFAYDNLAEEIRERMPTNKRTSKEIGFAHNGSTIRVATSVRGGTIHRLHISEFGKICALYKQKDREVITGSIPAVPQSGILVIESTAEGQDGEFYKITMRALALQQSQRQLGVKDYRLHFYGWWEEDDYRVDPSTVVITDKMREYFAQVEAKIGRKIDDEQRAWYVSTMESDFSGDQPKMWQEYPSFPEEAFQISTEGCYYANQLAAARSQGRILPRIPVEPVACDTFWDIGRGDMTSIWVSQDVAMQTRFIRYYEETGEDLSHYVTWLLGLGVVFGTHYLPHEAEYRRIGKNADTNQTIKEMLEELMPGHRFEVVPRISNIQAGIQQTRDAFQSAYFCEEGCDKGLHRLGNYRKKWDKANGRWHDEPMHDDNSHGSDAFRQWGQAKAQGMLRPAAAFMRKDPGGFKRKGSPMAR